MSDKNRDPAKCAKCGGTHFHLAEFRQYIGGMYSSSFGGELVPVGPAAEIRVCLCGQPVVPHERISLTEDLRKPLGESFEKALAFRQATELETIKRGLQEDFASPVELLSALETLKTLKKAVEQAEKDKERPAREPGPPPTQQPPTTERLVNLMVKK